ncbi:MAG: Uma2 family endonuclease [Gammaproteobacteria bacterium]
MKQPMRKPMTLAELEALEDATGQRYELWHGEPIAMTGGTLKHNLIALGLYRAIYPQLKPDCRVVVADVKLHLSEAADSDAAYPDVIVVCEFLPGSYQTRPLLLAEVLSDSSIRRDRVDKHSAYAALESLEAYLILSQEEVLVDVYQRAQDWQRERYQGLETEIPLAVPTLGLPLREIYADVLAG